MSFSLLCQYEREAAVHRLFVMGAVLYQAFRVERDAGVPEADRQACARQ